MKKLFVLLVLLVCVGHSYSASYNMSNTSQTVTCGSTDNFFDSGGAGNYANSQSFTMTISPSTAGQYVSVNFASFNLEAGYDYLYIYDGTNTSARLIGAFNGNVAVGTITSTTGSLTFRFTSDGGTVAAGWSATVSCSGSAGTPTIAVNTSSQTIACGTTYNFYDPGGFVGTYGYSTSYTLTVTAGTGGQCLSVTIPTFTVENGWDYLYIYDGATTGSTLLGTYTGGTAPGTLTSSTGSLTFRFTSDAFSNASGWSGTISCTSCPIAPILMSNTSQTITCGTSYSFYDSGGNGSNYGNSLTYQMTISPSTAGQYVSVNFASFNTETDFDYLYIYDGTSTSSPLIGMFNGAVALGTITSSTGSLTFRFTSDAATTAAGWSATLTCTGTPGSPTISENTSTQTITCGTTYNFYDSGGSPCNYSNSLSYTLTINASTAGQCVRAVFSSFSTESGFDYLYIYDGNSTASTLIGTYSGASSPGTITGTSGSLTFRFTSDGNTTATGWAATLSCSPGCSGTPTAGTANANPTSLGCGVATTTLSLSGATSACGITYQWQSSPDNATWSNISGATTTPYVASPAGSTYYQCVVSCGGNNATSSSVLVTSGSPSNDLCANASTITLNAGAMIGTYTGTATGNNACATADGALPTCFWAVDQNLWYKFTATYTGSYYVDVRGGTLTWPEVSVYTGSCGSLTLGGCAGGWASTTQPDGYYSSTYSYAGICSVTAGTTVYINVDDDGSAGTFTVNVGHQTNDNIGLATVLNNCGTTFNSSTIGGTNCGNCVGNGNYNDLDCNSGTQVTSGGSDVPTSMSVENDTYYQFCVAPSGPTTTFTITFTPVTASCIGPNAGSNPLQMNLYTGSGAALTWINGTTGTGSTFSPTVSLAANQCAIIEVDGSAGTNCDYQLSLSGVGCPLPVELISFTGQYVNATQSVLKWSVASEKNIKYYVIEKSIDGFNFVPIKTINSTGNTSAHRDYTTYDDNLSKGMNYYRLSSMDNNGSKEILSNAIVTNRSGLPNFTVYPNPNTGKFNIAANNFNSEEMQVEIFDIYGNKVWENSISLPDGGGSQELDLSGLNSGVYFIKARDGSVSYKRSLIITKND